MGSPRRLELTRIRRPTNKHGRHNHALCIFISRLPYSTIELKLTVCFSVRFFIQVLVATPNGGGNPVQVMASGPSNSHLQDEQWILPPILPASERPSSSSSHSAGLTSSQSKTKKNTHWGHIAFFYLVEQMHRWERFVFRYDKQFSSSGALKAIEGQLIPTR